MVRRRARQRLHSARPTGAALHVRNSLDGPEAGQIHQTSTDVTCRHVRRNPRRSLRATSTRTRRWAVKLLLNTRAEHHEIIKAIDIATTGPSNPAEEEGAKNGIVKGPGKMTRY